MILAVAPISCSATVQHHADLARSSQHALDLASRMVASARASHDAGATIRWARRYSELRKSMDALALAG